MNLILSDVEETVMIVDSVDGSYEGQGAVKVSISTCKVNWLQLDDVQYRSRKGKWTCFLLEGMV